MSKRTDQIDDRFVECRAWNHAWKATDVTADGGTYVQHFRCLRGCNTVRHLKINRRTGELSGNSYTYPDGYTVTGGVLSRAERGSLRLRAVQ